MRIEFKITRDSHKHLPVMQRYLTNPIIETYDFIFTTTSRKVTGVNEHISSWNIKLQMRGQGMSIAHTNYSNLQNRNKMKKSLDAHNRQVFVERFTKIIIKAI